MCTYPPWVTKHLCAGRIVKERNGRYYLYRRTSQRVPGRRNPVPQDEYLGSIDEEHGFVPCTKRRINVSHIRAYEYGYSKVLYELCPESWKRTVGSDWNDVLITAILDVSATSYLQLQVTSEISRTTLSRIKTERTTLYRRMMETYRITKEEILSLQSIHLLIFDDKTRYLTAVNKQQADILARIPVSLEVY